MLNPKTSESNTTSWRVGLEILPSRSRKSMAVNHSSPVSRTSRAKSCRCCTRHTNSCRKRASVEVSKVRWTASVMVCSVRLLGIALPLFEIGLIRSVVDDDAAGVVVGDGLVGDARVVEGIGGGGGKRPKLPGFEVGAHLFQAPCGVDDAQLSAVGAEYP